MKGRLRRIIGFIIFFLFIFFVLVFLFKALPGSFFQVQTVFIYSEPAIFANDIDFFKKRVNLLFLDTQSYMQAIKQKYPLVKSVTIKKQWPRDLILFITPRKPLVKKEGLESTMYIDEEGMVLPSYKNFNELPLSLLDCKTSQLMIGNIIQEKSVIQILHVVSQLEESGFLISHIACPDLQTAILDIDETRVTISANEVPAHVVSSLQFLFKQFRIEGKKPKAVDLRFTKPVLDFGNVKNASESSDLAN